MSRFTWDEDDIVIKNPEKKRSKKESRQRARLAARWLEALNRSKNAQNTHH